jgi:hypothetical protein
MGMMVAQHKAIDLSPEDRTVVERLLARQLKDDDVVEVSARDEEMATRLYALNQFLDGSRKISAGFADMPEEDLNALIDEACDYVRHNPE